MILIEEAIDRVQSQYSKGARSVDSRLSSRHIYSCLLDARSTLISQQSSKNQNISHWAYQTLTTVTLDLTIVGGCQMLKSRLRLPKVIGDKNKDLVGRVSTDAGDIVFSRGKFENRKYAIGNRFTPDIPRSYLEGGYLYISNLRLLNLARVPGLFEDPIEVYNFNAASTNCIECNTKDYNTIEFPLDRRLFNTCVDMATQRLVILFSQMKQDVTNNSMDDNNNTGVMIHQPNYGQQDES